MIITITQLPPPIHKQWSSLRLLQALPLCTAWGDGSALWCVVRVSGRGKLQPPPDQYLPMVHVCLRGRPSSRWSDYSSRLSWKSVTWKTQYISGRLTLMNTSSQRLGRKNLQKWSLWKGSGHSVIIRKELVDIFILQFSFYFNLIISKFFHCSAIILHNIFHYRSMESSVQG